MAKSVYGVTCVVCRACRVSCRGAVPALGGAGGLEGRVGDGLVLLEFADFGRNERELLEVDQALHLVRQLLEMFRDQVYERPYW